VYGNDVAAVKLSTQANSTDRILRTMASGPCWPCSEIQSMKQACLALFTLMSFFAGIHSFGQGSAMFRGDPAHSGIYAGEGVPAFHRVRWSFHTNGEVVSSPAIVGEVVYFGSNDGNLYAMDAASGKLHWKFETGSAIPSSPAVAAGIVYFASQLRW
jgi:hypothetical protein